MLPHVKIETKYVLDNIFVSLYNCIGGKIMSEEYVTTNIRIPKNLWMSLKEKAMHDEKSLAQLFREGAKHILLGGKLKKVKFKNDPFFKIIGKGFSRKNGSVKHDRDIYGNKDFC